MTKQWFRALVVASVWVAGCGGGVTGGDVDGGGEGECRTGWADCDRIPDGECETRLSNDDDNCGACGVRCDFDNAVSECERSECRLVACRDGFFDANEDPDDGCELECDPTAEDLPDLMATDANCDGIDGDASRALFVAKSGDDDNPGTQEAPLARISTAIARAAADPDRDHVYVSTGTFVEQVTLADGVSLWGGYAADDAWKRNPANLTRLEWPTFENGRLIVVSGASIASPTVFSGFEVIAADATDADAGASSYGIHCAMCPGLVIEGNTIVAGDGGHGLDGGDGINGGNGSTGSSGGSGSCDSSGWGSGGSGGGSSCGRNGGSGGRGGSEGNYSGWSGNTGVVGSLGGSGGSGGDPGRDGGDGQNGSSGSDGGNGSGGQGGFLDNGYWVTAPGDNGVTGGHGNGGGGGGGGGGQGCVLCDNGAGNGGGGGGGGGCGGGGGRGGAGGGGSFGVFLVSSTGAVVRDNTITAGNGGNGGRGGAGALGGFGASGGSGNTHCSSQIGAGGDGGRGGNGGDGGHAGGGAGGPSFAIFTLDTAIDTSSNGLAVGDAGVGGDSPANPGFPGQAAVTHAE